MPTFKLQVVLDHRQFIEDSLQKELADIRQQAIEARHQLEMLKRKEMDTAAALKQEQTDGLSSSQVVAYHAYFKRLSESLAGQEKVVGQIKARESAKQDELREAVKQRQILEKLKDQDLARHRLSVLKKEMEFIDEIAVNQFVRKRLEKNGDGQ